jgi:co-chaperonin GroES (HSP10)
MSDAITMDASANTIKPIGDRVLLRLKEIEKKIAVRPSGIIMPGQDAVSAGQAIGGSMGVVYSRSCW